MSCWHKHKLQDASCDGGGDETATTCTLYCRVPPGAAVLLRSAVSNRGSDRGGGSPEGCVHDQGEGLSTVIVASVASTRRLCAAVAEGKNRHAPPGRSGGHHPSANNPLRALAPTPQVAHTLAAGSSEPSLAAFQLSTPLQPPAVALQCPPEPLPSFGEDGCAWTSAAPWEASESQISVTGAAAAGSPVPPPPTALTAGKQCHGEVGSAQGGDAAGWEGWWWELAASPPPLGSLDGMELCEEGATLREAISLAS